MTEHNKLDQLRIELDELTRKSKRAKETHDLLESQRAEAERNYKYRLDADFRAAKAEHETREEYTSKTQALRREPLSANSRDFFISNEILQEKYFCELSEKGEKND